MREWASSAFAEHRDKLDPSDVVTAEMLIEAQDWVVFASFLATLLLMGNLASQRDLAAIDRFSRAGKFGNNRGIRHLLAA